MLLQGSPRRRTSVGFVKWFGGINKKTGKENQFGFIESIDGDDLFVHASQLGGVVPEEGNFAIFTVDAKDADKIRAVEVAICDDTETFNTEPLIEYLYDIEGFQKVLVTAKYRDVLRSLVNRKDNEWATGFLEEVLPRSKAALYVVGELLADSATQTRLLKPLSFDELESIDHTFKYVPKCHFDNEHARSFQWLRGKSSAERDSFFQHKINDLSLSFVLACVFEGLINDPNMLDRHTDDIKLFVEQALQKRFTSSQEVNNRIILLDYVRETFHRSFTGFDELLSCPAMVPFFELPLIKQKVFSKDRSFVDDVERSGRMSRDPETFVLSRLFPLIWDGNDDLTVEAAFFHELWEALLSGQLDVDHPGFLKLFPSCQTLGPHLSCEATYWQKKELFLCRGRRCDDPQIMPDLDKHFFDFNIYDWLSYFGRSYEKADQPSRRDFPIKLAGYFNRLKDLRAVLDCRSCGDLMKPDFKYSRVEVRVFDPVTQSTISKQLIAAYRATVFYCDNPKCADRDAKHYLNHCLGHKCNKIIDSRDLGKCENGFYRCSCGSCCKEHQLEAEQRKRQLEQMVQDRGSRRFGR